MPPGGQPLKPRHGHSAPRRATPRRATPWNPDTRTVPPRKAAPETPTRAQCPPGRQPLKPQLGHSARPGGQPLEPSDTGTLAGRLPSLGSLMSVNGSASGRLVAKRPLAGEHSGPLDLESWKKTVPLPVTGRVDRCWDVVPAAGVSTASLGRRWFSRRLLACSDVLDGRTGAAFRRG